MWAWIDYRKLSFCATAGFRFLVYYALEFPLRLLYLRGPELAGYGFWEGRSNGEICNQLTGVSASHWTATAANALDCSSLIERKFGSLLIGVYFAMYIFILTTVAWTLIRRCLKRFIM